MGRKPCCEKVGLKRGPWAAEEDKKLVSFINTHGISCWRAVPKLAGLLRCGKSCRLRWTNYLRPDLKRGIFAEAEENLILELHATLGNRWSRIAVQLPGRTDNEIKNYWNTRLKKRLRSMGLDPNTHKPVENSGRDGDPGTVDGYEENSSVIVSTSHNSESTPDESLVPAPQVSEQVAAQLKTFEGEPGGNVLVDMIPKSEPVCMNPKQSNSGLQFSSSDFDVNAKHKEASSPNRLENYHILSLQYTAQNGPKFEVEEDSFMGSLHPHARHARQEGNWLNSTAREHELPIGAGTSGGLSEELAASVGIFQELTASTGGSLLRQASGFTLSDMAVGNWSFLGEIHGQLASCYGFTSDFSSWNDHIFAQPPGAGRPSEEPELQKLAAILDQI